MEWACLVYPRRIPRARSGRLPEFPFVVELFDLLLGRPCCTSVPRIVDVVAKAQSTCPFALPPSLPVVATTGTAFDACRVLCLESLLVLDDVESEAVTLLQRLDVGIGDVYEDSCVYAVPCELSSLTSAVTMNPYPSSSEKVCTVPSARCLALSFLLSGPLLPPPVVHSCWWR